MENRVITENNSERMEVKTDEDRFCIQQEFKGRLPDMINTYKVIILNREEAVRIYNELGQWIRREIRY